jgi:uncharacterized protein
MNLKVLKNMNNNLLKIGEIDSITGNTVTVRLSDEIKSEMPIINGVVYRAGQLGSFLKIRLGYANIYGVVTQIGSNAIPENLKDVWARNYEAMKNLRLVSMVLVGEQIGRKFDRGITQYPSPGDSVHIVTIEDLEIIYGGYNFNSSITVGNISVSESLEAKIDLDKLISRHCAIVGSTGSGKSNSVGVLLKSISDKKFKSSRILIIDPHGEYDEVLKEYSKVYKINASKEIGENELYIPYWALSLDEFLKIFPGTLSDTAREYIRVKVYENKLESLNLLDIKGINEKAITADSPIPFSIEKLWFELDDFERRTILKDRITLTDLVEKGNYKEWKSNIYTAAAIGGGEPYLNNERKGILNFLDNMRSKCLDKRYKFLFNPDGWYVDFTGNWNYKKGEWETKKEIKITSSIDELIFNWIGSEKPITILDLSGVPSEIMTSLSGTLINIIYDALFWGQNETVGGKKQPLLIVLEEAHNYLKAGENSIASRTVQRISKEGRKYGVGLILITQRPSELDETVLSQCGTLIALRMNNTKDRGHINGAVQDELQKLIDLLPSLRTGEGIITGEAVKIPTRVKFYKLSNAPKSSDPKASEEWLKDKPQKDNYKKAITNWRNQTF